VNLFAEQWGRETGKLVLPRVRLLANGRYTVLLTAAGGGRSTCGPLALNRWNGDRIEDRDGYFCYLRDLDDGTVWSLGRQPTLTAVSDYRLDDAPGVFRLSRSEHGIEALLEVCVHPDLDVELRRVTLRNHSGRERLIEVTGFLEVVLDHPAAFAAHPAFSKLFVQTEFLADEEALLVRRRPRSAGETWPWLINALLGPGTLQFETDRARFIGRGYGYTAPQALSGREPLAGGVGNVLDPALVLRRQVRLPAGGREELTFVLGVAGAREDAIALLGRYRTGGGFADVCQAASERERDRCRRFELSDDQALALQALAGAMLYADPALGATLAIRERAAEAASCIWGYGVATERPFAVVDGRHPVVVAPIIKAQRYWRALGLETTLLVLTDGAPPADSAADAGDGISYRPLTDIPSASLEVLLAAARLVVGDRLPDLERDTGGVVTVAAAPLAAALSPALEAADPTALLFDNGYGGFAADGTEYVIRLIPEAGRLRLPPLPWINVLGNEQFGCLISETGAGYTWSRNSREHRLTPWSNDPLLDPHGEALYLRDRESGRVWSPLPGPCPAPGSSYQTRHGFGYSRFHHESAGLEQETTVFVSRHDPVKLIRLSLYNRDVVARRLAVVCYQQLVLGSTPGASSRLIVTACDEAARLLSAVNRLAGEFVEGVAFAAVVPREEGTWSATSDRAAFLGPDGGPARPQALLSDEPLDGRYGAGLDPCFAQQVVFELAPGDSQTLYFLFGEARSVAEMRRLVEHYRQAGAGDYALAEITAFWRDTLTALRVETPLPAIDLLLNGWLSYQNLVCRLWGRSAFYQSGGAFGFRDQLQDAAAFIYLRPDITRQQILLNAEHQFREGDVLHWWHPAPLERGLRTRFSDDLNWLPYVVAGYVKTTGDWGLLDEQASFVSAPLLAEGQDEAYLQPEMTKDSADIYEHCCRALDRSLTQGAHGLPLMGTGDWNDGMNRVGREGRGESVWMGFFLYYIIEEFLPLCERRGDQTRIERYRAYREQLRVALNDAGWDGEWYRRAYYDDGTPLGTKDGDECRIDALAQAWAVISGAAPPERAAQAMDAVTEYLVAEQDGLIRLLALPFVNTPHDPGYIKGYVAGVRENGGQYTHAACWVVRALAELGRHEQAARLLAMLSPISHTSTAAQTEVYKLEPYVVAADVYGVTPHVGRGGWSWYTGSAGWLYRVALESVLGFGLEEGKTLVLQPRLPTDWPGFRLDYRLPDDGTRFVIEVSNPDGGNAVVAASLDGKSLAVTGGVARLPLCRDGQEHRAEVVLGTVVGVAGVG
jgi:cyclic beta-1,2-glucan synthetase